MGTQGNSYDAVVIGSGPNGLAAAITLAEKGRSVLVVEARDTLGGAVATDELTLPGFRHDTFSSVYPAAAASPVWARMPLEHFGLRWVHPPIAMAHPLPDGDAVALYRDVDRTVASLDRQAPGDGERWRAFVAPYLRHFGAVRATMLGGFPPITGGLRLAAAFKLEGTLEFARLLLLPATVLAAELFQSPGAAGWLFGSVLHGDVPPNEAGSAITAAYLDILGHAAGWPSPEGGAGRFAEALVGYFQSLGGVTRRGACDRRGLRQQQGARRDPLRRRVHLRSPGDRRRHAAGAAGPGRRRPARDLRYTHAALPLWAGDGQAGLGARGTDPLDGRRAARGGDGPRRWAAR